MIKAIESPANPFVKRLAALKEKKMRDSDGVFVIEGKNFVDAIPEDWHVERYVLSESFYTSRLGAGESLVYAGRADVYVLSEQAFKKVSDTVSPQGVLAVCRQKKYTLEACLREKDGLLVFGECIADPGNLGTVIRTAAASGCQAVLLSDGSASAHNPKTLRAAAGALFHVPVVEGTDTESALAALAGAGYNIVAADVAGDAYPYDTDFTQNCCVLIGNEANGLTETALGRAGTRVRIPMSPNVESLNASVACGVLLYEAVRQRLAAQLGGKC